MSDDFTPGAAWSSSFTGTPYWLRFELGGEELSNQDSPVPRFVQALHRSRTICDAVFGESHRLWAIVASHCDSRNDLFAPDADWFETLSRIGFRATAVSEWNARLNPDDPEEDPEAFLWHSFDISSDIPSRDALLWCSLTYEMPIQPKCPVIVYLADFQRGILLHVYDDRGMDVSALAADTLLPFYRQFDPWLLDYDRSRMQVAFENS